MRMLVDSGDMTPAATRQIQNVLDAERITLIEFTLDEFSEATGLDRTSMELTRAWGNFMHIGQRLPFAEWWAKHQGDYV